MLSAMEVVGGNDVVLAAGIAVAATMQLFVCTPETLLRTVALKSWNQENSGKITGTKRGYTLSITADALSELKGID